MVKQTQQKQLSQLLKKHEDFVQTQSGKIRCQITNHQMTNLKQFKQYLKGRAYKRGLESNFNFKDFSEYLDAHFTNPKLLFCRITGEKVVNKRSVVEKHVKGKRYLKAFKRVKEEEKRQQEKEEEKKRIMKEKRQKWRESKQQKGKQEIEEQLEERKEEEEMEVEDIIDDDQEESEEEEPQPPPTKKSKPFNASKHKKISKPVEKPVNKTQKVSKVKAIIKEKKVKQSK